MKKAASGVVLLVFALAIGLGDKSQLMRSYLLAFLFWIAVPLGAMGLCCLHHLTGGRWGKGLRPYWESVLPTVPYFALFFIPLVLGMQYLFPWADPHHHAEGHHVITPFKQWYLSAPAFTVRGIVYFALWGFIAKMLDRWGREFAHEEHAPSRLQVLGGVGLAAYALTITLASIDWAMSLDPEWYSTIYGMIFMVGQALSALSFGAWITARWMRDKKIEGATQGHFHDFGNLLLAFVMLWAYVSLSQFLIIWSANIPEEVPWYIDRSKGGWEVQAVVNVVLQFFAPFLLLLAKARKTDLRALGMIAGVIFLMRFFDLMWTIKPSFSPSWSLHPLDVLCFLGMGAVCLAVWDWKQQSASRVIEKDLSEHH